jgi:hypothetical protein
MKTVLDLLRKLTTTGRNFTNSLRLCTLFPWSPFHLNPFILDLLLGLLDHDIEGPLDPIPLLIVWRVFLDLDSGPHLIQYL